MDKYRDRVPVRTVGSGTHYDGKIWYESLSSICSINGKPTSDVKKSMLTAGDQVTVTFNNKTYHGVVDPTGDLAGPESEAPLTAHAPPPPSLLDSRDDTQGKLDDGSPPLENPLAEQDPTQDGQPRQEKPPRADA